MQLLALMSVLKVLIGVVSIPPALIFLTATSAPVMLGFQDSPAKVHTESDFKWSLRE